MRARSCCHAGLVDSGEKASERSSSPRIAPRSVNFRHRCDCNRLLPASRDRQSIAYALRRQSGYLFHGAVLLLAVASTLSRVQPHTNAQIVRARAQRLSREPHLARICEANRRQDCNQLARVSRSRTHVAAHRIAVDFSRPQNAVSPCRDGHFSSGTLSRDLDVAALCRAGYLSGFAIRNPEHAASTSVALARRGTRSRRDARCADGSYRNDRLPVDGGAASLACRATVAERQFAPCTRSE